MDVPLPYDLTEDQLVLDPASIGVKRMDVMEFLAFDAETDEFPLILQGAVLLKVRNPELDIFECLDTSIIWLRG